MAETLVIWAKGQFLLLFYLQFIFLGAVFCSVFYILYKKSKRREALMDLEPMAQNETVGIELSDEIARLVALRDRVWPPMAGNNEAEGYELAKEQHSVAYKHLKEKFDDLTHDLEEQKEKNEERIGEIKDNYKEKIETIKQEKQKGLEDVKAQIEEEYRQKILNGEQKENILQAEVGQTHESYQKLELEKRSMETRVEVFEGEIKSLTEKMGRLSVEIENSKALNSELEKKLAEYAKSEEEYKSQMSELEGLRVQSIKAEKLQNEIRALETDARNTEKQIFDLEKLTEDKDRLIDKMRQENSSLIQMVKTRDERENISSVMPSKNSNFDRASLEQSSRTATQSSHKASVRSEEERIQDDQDRLVAEFEKVLMGE